MTPDPAEPSGLSPARWAELDLEKRALLQRPEDSIEERLARGQRLSAQAAALLRAVRHEPIQPA